MNKQVADWFANRGLTQETLDKFGITFDGQKIVIPVRDTAGLVLFNKYRRHPLSGAGPKYWYQPGGKTTLFNYQLDQVTVIITESELDAVLCEQQGHHSVSSTGGSQAFPAEWAELFIGKEVYIWYDNDEAGAKGAVRLARLMPNAKIICWPEMCRAKDVTEWLQHNSISTIKGLQLSAIQLPGTIDGCVSLRRQLQAVNLSTMIVEEHRRQLVEAKKKPVHRISTDLVGIKAIPITDYMKFERGYAKCFWHDESSPSLFYYPRTNSVYCFGCAKAGDVIDVVQAVNKCDFKQAIKILQGTL